jgi:hypothetical protein
VGAFDKLGWAWDPGNSEGVRIDIRGTQIEIDREIFENPFAHISGNIHFAGENFCATCDNLESDIGTTDIRVRRIVWSITTDSSPSDEIAHHQDRWKRFIVWHSLHSPGLLLEPPHLRPSMWNSRHEVRAARISDFSKLPPLLAPWTQQTSKRPAATYSGWRCQDKHRQTGLEGRDRKLRAITPSPSSYPYPAPNPDARSTSSDRASGPLKILRRSE